MKKLSIEEKAKAYDEALKVLHKYDGANIMFSQSLKEEMFPELRESEDERIRKHLISFFDNLVTFGNASICETEDTKVDNILAWLEKQGEIVAYYEDRLDRCACDNFNKGYKKALEKQGEKKPADKVESSAFKDKLLELFQKFRYIKEGVPTNGDIIDYVDAHIQELIDTVQNKPWSEEDYNMLDELLDYCELSIAYNGKGTLQANVWEKRKDWLKNLKDNG